MGRLWSAGLTALLCATAFVMGMNVRTHTDEPYPPPDVHSVTVSGVDCPTEDSCAVDYDHGTWRITEVTP